MLDFHASSLYNWHLEMIIDKEESGDVQSLNFFRDNIKFSIHCPAIIPIFNKPFGFGKIEKLEFGLNK